MAGKVWTKEEEQYLVGHYGVDTLGKIANVLVGRTEDAVKGHAMVLGLRTTLYYWNDVDVAKLKELAHDRTAKELAEFLGRTEPSIRGKLMQQGIKCKAAPKTVVNEDFFQMWSAEMAYVLGYWFADGFIGSKEGYKAFSISSCDTDHLWKMLDLMESEHNVKIDESRNGFGSFRIRNEKIYDDVCRLGGCERKSLVLRWPWVPISVVKDFIRGYVDGDGCIRINRSRKGNESYQLTVAGTSHFLSGLSKTVEDLLGITCPALMKNGKIYVIAYSSIKARCLCFWLYANASLALERKRRLAEACWSREGRTIQSRSLTPKMCALFPHIIPERYRLVKEKE